MPLGRALLEAQDLLIQIGQEHYLPINAQTVCRLTDLKLQPTEKIKHVPVGHRSRTLKKAPNASTQSTGPHEKTTTNLGILAYLEASLGPMDFYEFYTAAKALIALITPLQINPIGITYNNGRPDLTAQASIVPKSTLIPQYHTPPNPLTLLDLYEYGLANLQATPLPQTNARRVGKTTSPHFVRGLTSWDKLKSPNLTQSIDTP